MRRIQRSELTQLANEWNFSLDETEQDEFHALTEYLADILDRLDGLTCPALESVAAIRDPGRRPMEGEDPYNAIVRWCSVKAEGEGEAEGILSGLRLVLKDCIAIAGVPMTCGSPILRDFVPDRDSVLTRRVLLAGTEIVATTNMDDLAWSAGGDTSTHGPTLNPFDLDRTAGGSSGGSAAALHYDDADVAIGCDQGGSIRMPAAWCGVIGLKPTHGLVPYSGIVGIDQTLDHVGPMARTSRDAARLLQAIAGRDESDPRQRGEVQVRDYLRAVARAPDDLRSVKIGIVPEAFGDAVGTDDAIADAVQGAIERFAGLGAEVRDTPVPEHLQAASILFACGVEGMAALVSGGGNGYHWRGRCWPELAVAIGEGLRTSSARLSPHVKLALIYGTRLRKHYSGSIYARAQNLRRLLSAGYDRALRDADYLVLPTTPGRPHKHDASVLTSEHVRRDWAIVANTAQTDMTGHPAITLPAATADGLPAGVMFVGRHFDETGLLALAQTYEQNFEWVPVRPGDPRR